MLKMPVKPILNAMSPEEEIRFLVTKKLEESQIMADRARDYLVKTSGKEVSEERGKLVTKVMRHAVQDQIDAPKLTQHTCQCCGQGGDLQSHHSGRKFRFAYVQSAFLCYWWRTGHDELGAYHMRDLLVDLEEDPEVPYGHKLADQSFLEAWREFHDYHTEGRFMVLCPECHENAHRVEDEQRIDDWWKTKMGVGVHLAKVVLNRVTGTDKPGVYHQEIVFQKPGGEIARLKFLATPGHQDGTKAMLREALGDDPEQWKGRECIVVIEPIPDNSSPTGYSTTGWIMTEIRRAH